jgi:hypothetical protein
MNVQELIESLKSLPPDKKVVIRGYEEGYNDISEIREIRIVLRPDLPWYYGQYLLGSKQDDIEAIELFGENKNENI